MALGTLNASLVTLRVMEFLRKQFPVIGAVSTDFSDATVKFGQQVIGRVVTPPAVQDYDTVTGYAPTGTTVLDVPVTMDEHRHATVEFNVEELSSTDRNLIDEQAGPAAYSLGKDAVDKLLALITTTNFPTETAEAVANVDRVTMGKLRLGLNEQGASPFERFGILGGESFENLTDDAKIISRDYSVRGAEEDNRAFGRLTGIKGFGSIDEYVDLPTTDNLIGFFGTKASLLLTSRLPKDPALIMPEIAGGGKVEIVRDPDTGMAMLVRTWYDWKLGKVYFSLVWMFGVAIGVPGHGRRLVHTATASSS